MKLGFIPQDIWILRITDFPCKSTIKCHCMVLSLACFLWAHLGLLGPSLYLVPYIHADMWHAFWHYFVNTYLITGSFSILFSARQCNNSHLGAVHALFRGCVCWQNNKQRTVAPYSPDMNPWNFVPMVHIKDNLYSNNPHTEDDLKVFRL